MIRPYVYAALILFPVAILAMEEKIIVPPQFLEPVTEESFNLNGSQSFLCELFGIDPRFCQLPEVVQFNIAQRIKRLYPEAFRGWETWKPIAEIKMHHTRAAQGWAAEDGRKKLVSLATGITDFAIAPRGQFLVSSLADGKLVFCNMENFQNAGELKVGSPEVNNSDEVSRSKVAISDDEALIAVSVGSKIFIYDTDKPDERRFFDIGAGCEVHKILFKKNSSMLYVIGDCVQAADQKRSFLHIFDTKTGICLVKNAIQSDVQRIAFSHDKTKFAVIGLIHGNTILLDL